MKHCYTFWVLFFSVAATTALSAQMGCPGCVISLPDSLAADTIYLSDAPDGQVNRAYQGDLSFRMPKTTTPVNANDPETPPGLPISRVTIQQVVGLPPGLSWEASQLEFVTDEQTDGCVRLCGTPLLPGLYEVQVVIKARVLIIDEITSFSFPLLIEPAESVTDGFTLINGQGCGMVTAGFVNNMPSNGNPGFTYRWDFGNGNISPQENPQPQTYSVPGTYPVSYRAIVDTAGFFLTQVVVEATDCGDIFGNAPDIMIKVFDPDGEEIFASNTINNTTFPLTFNTNIRIGEGVYALHVIDDDDGGEGADDLCGVITLNQQTNGTITAGPLRATLSVLHPVDTVISMDTVRVFAQPAPPEFVEFIPFIPCMGDTIPLEVVNYDESLQWYRDSLPLAVDSNVLAITESGVYWVVYTSPEGCQSVSEQRLYGFATPPQSFTLVQMGNLLRSPQEGNWPDTYSYQWSRNGEAIEGATEPKYCATANGSYTLHLTDELTGCTRSITLANVTHDPGLPCTTPTQEPEVAGAWTLYPNPSAGQVWLRYDGPLSGRVNIRLFDALGRLVHTQVESYGGAGAAVELLTPELAAGVYWLDVSGVDGLSLYRERVVVQ